MGRRSLWASVRELAFSAGQRSTRPQSKRHKRSLRFERLEDKALLAADLTLDISDGSVSVEPGGTVAYQFEYANIGDAAAVATLHTAIPAHTSFAAEANEAPWSCSEDTPPWWPRICTLELGDVEAGASDTVEFVVTVDSNLSTRVRQISNRGYISGDDDGWPRNDFGAAFTPVIHRFHDLQIDVSDGDADVTPGGTIQYTLDYTNGGEAEAPGATITMRLPPHTSFDAESSSEGWTCDETVCSLPVGTVASGAEGSATMAVVLDGDVATTVRRIGASVSIVDDGSGAADANRRNNTGFESTTVVHPLPDLSIAMDDGDAGVAPGELITYTIDYANEGTFDATGVTITIEVPAHTTFVGDSSSAGWDCGEEACTLAVGNLASGSNDTATFAVLVDAELSTYVRRIYASASIADDGTAGRDANPRNNRASERITVHHALPDVSLQINDGDAVLTPDASVIYTFDYANAGRLDAEGVELHVYLPRYVQFTAEGSSEGWACSAGRCTLDVGSLSVDETGTATLAVTADANLSPRMRHIYVLARIADDGAHGPDADPYNNVALAWTPVDRG